MPPSPPLTVREMAGVFGPFLLLPDRSKLLSSPFFHVPFDYFGVSLLLIFSLPHSPFARTNPVPFPVFFIYSPLKGPC